MQACRVQNAALAHVIYRGGDGNSPAGRTLFGAEICLDLLNLQGSSRVALQLPTKFGTAQDSSIHQTH